MEKNIKKILTIVSLCSVVVCVALLIGAVFGLATFEGILFSILLTFAILGIACGFAINALNLLNRVKVVSIICLALLTVISLASIIVVWNGFSASTVISNLIWTLAIATIFFIIIININAKVGEKYKLLQAITYILIIIVDVVLTLEIWGLGLFSINGIWQVFAVACLGVFAMLLTLGILGKKSPNTDNNDYVKIPKTRYDQLLKEIKTLKQENAKLKNKKH